jgi:hypothetical protein
MTLVVLLIEFIMVMTLDGRQVEINPSQIVTIARPRDDDRLVSDKVRCVITLTDGKVISLIEECSHVKQRLEER